MSFQTSGPVYQCIPNFSEGRRPEVIKAIAEAITTTPGVVLIDQSADSDHNRCVMTFLGDVAAVQSAALASARVAVERMDLRTHTGVHPRTGALDVLPVVPLRNTGREEAIALARSLGANIAAELSLPVYLYEWAAFPGREKTLPAIRKGNWDNRRLGNESISQFPNFPVPQSPNLLHPPPDFGPPAPHPTAGIAIVGARGPLIAYNINLDTTEIRVAWRIAQRIREERQHRPELAGLRALGLYLASQDCAQVSMNLTRPEQTPMPAVFDFVQQAARELGVEVRESEVIGAIPQAALDGHPPERIAWKAYKPTQILETWLEPSGNNHY